MHEWKRIICLSIGILGMHCGVVWADKSASAQWVKDETANGSTAVYLSRTFTWKSGTFQAMPDSFFDKRNSISGTFLVGTFRIVSNNSSYLMKGLHGEPYNESITTELIDCENGYAGTLRDIGKLNGKVVWDDPVQDKDILMMQTGFERSWDRKLCQLHEGKPLSQVLTPPSIE